MWPALQERGGLLLSGLAAVSRLTLVDIMLGRYGCCGDTPRKSNLLVVVRRCRRRHGVAMAMLRRCYGAAATMTW